ncbi:MAG: cell division protein FtsW [Anaplasmataceae bacterium]|nr:cell division protein FtsW [Anaplasmataceae bacterium]
MNRIFTRNARQPDYFFLGIIILLVIFGLVMLTSASSHLGQARFGDAYYYLKQQLIKGLMVGLLGFFVAYYLNYRNYKKWAVWLLLISLGLLLMVFTSFGVARGGADRWVALGPITFQPSEILKITYVLYVAAWLANARVQRHRHYSQGLIPFLVISGIVGGILIMQPATSTVAILLGAGALMYFVSGAPWRFMVVSFILGVVVLAGLVAVTPYRLERIKSFISSGEDSLDIGYHVTQAQIAIGSGQLTGVGYGESIAKISLLPDPLADSIFAVIAEELGFIGSSVLIVLFAILTFKILWMAKRSRDHFAQSILVGFGVIIGGQAFLHMAAISGLLPPTGVPLPFISYGGTALAVFLTMSGIVANISRSQ